METNLEKFARVQREREALPWNDPRQADLAMEDHRLFSRDTVAENPLMAIPLAAMIPAYAATKYIAKNPLIRPELRNAINQSGLTDEAATPPSWGQIGSAFTGIGQGLGDAFGNSLRDLQQRIRR